MLQNSYKLERNKAIADEWKPGTNTLREIAIKYGLSTVRIYQIVLAERKRRENELWKQSGEP